MAQQALTTQAAVGGRLLLGLGPSHPEWVASAYGESYDRPIRHVNKYLGVLESAFALKGRVDFVGETYRSTSALDVPGAVDPPIFLAALGPAMLRLAGEHTNGTITWMGDERAHSEHVVPRINAAAQSAGRPAPRVIAGLPVAVCDDATAGRDEAARRFAIYGDIPTYARMLARGNADGPADVCVVGTERDVEARLRSYAATGITDLLAAVFPVGDDAPASRQRTMDFLASLAPRLGGALA
jgi:F420-dependent oxidoreductase-like protein